MRHADVPLAFRWHGAIEAERKRDAKVRRLRRERFLGKALTAAWLLLVVGAIVGEVLGL